MAEIFTTTESAVIAGKKINYLITHKRSIQQATPNFSNPKKGWVKGEKQKTKVVPMSDGRLMVFFDKFTGKTGYMICENMDDLRSKFELEEGVETISKVEVK